MHIPEGLGAYLTYRILHSTIEEAQSAPNQAPPSLTPMLTLDTLLTKVRACTLCAAHLPLGPRGARCMTPGCRSTTPAVTGCASGWACRVRCFTTHSKWPSCPWAFVFLVPAPRAICRRAQNAPLLAHLTHIQLTLVIGRYAQAYHLPQRGASVAEVVRAWHCTWPHTVALPHPSPRNNRWLKQNPWFEAELLPPLRLRVQEVLTPGASI